MNKRVYLPTIILIAIILLAFSLRLYNLTYHSFWFDEAVSVYWARQSVPRILEVGFTLVEDRLPPLYYLSLKGWTGLTGFSETGVRSLTVMFGVLLVPVSAGIAAMLFNRRIAWFTALLVGLNPFLIWYSQEARMYAPAVLFGALAVWAFLKYIQSATQPLSDSTPQQHSQQALIPSTSLRTSPHPSHFARQGFILLFILFAVLSLYSHLYAGFLLPALGLWLIISYPRAWRLWLMFAASGLVIALAYAPILLAIWRFSGEAAPGDPLGNLAQHAWWLIQSFTLWKAPLSPWLTTAIPALVILFALSACLATPPSPCVRRASALRHPRLLITLLLLVPFLIATLLLFRNHLAFFGERYFIVMTPWLLLLAAAGADNLGCRLAHYTSKIRQYPSDLAVYVPYSLLVMATILPVPGQWTIPAAKEAWRQSAGYLAVHAQNNDAILIHPDWVRYPFQFYFQGPGQTYAAFSTVTAATDLDGPLQGVVNDHPVVWLIQSHLDGPDPDRLVEQWLAARYPLVTELYPPGISLKGYAPGYRLDSLPPAATPVDVSFNNGMRLVGYQIESPVAATDDLFHPPSGWAHVILYWTADQPITQEMVPYIHLVGPEGVWGASLERSNDALKLFPPSRWRADNGATPIIRHDVDVNLNPATPPGTYQLVVGLTGSETQHVLGLVEIR
jgi:uncharacterized membrane protein